MDALRFSQVSESEKKEINKAKDQIVEAERRLAELVMRHLGREALVPGEGDCAIFRFPTELSGNSIEVIRINGKVVGVYVDPPGVCAAVS